MWDITRNETYVVRCACSHDHTHAHDNEYEQLPSTVLLRLAISNKVVGATSSPDMRLVPLHMFWSCWLCGVARLTDTPRTPWRVLRSCTRWVTVSGGFASSRWRVISHNAFVMCLC